MIDKEAKNIDAVTVGTPDHIHAVASMAAIRAGKHVYCQKPLTHTLHECRELTKAAQGRRRDDPDGQPGARHRGRPPDQRVDPGRGDRRGPRGPRLVRPRGTLWKQGIGRPKESPPIPLDVRLEPLAGPDPGAALQPDLRPARAGGAGATSAPGRWATWAATSSTTPSGPWAWARRPRSRRRSRSTARSWTGSRISRPIRSPRSSRSSSPRGASCRRSG